jgi:predicted glycoside hydrolase/deacetylase ChbG (UPF0249 family)
MLFLALAVLRRAWTESLPSRRWKLLKAAFHPQKLGPWERRPEEASLEISLIFPLPLDSVTPLNPGQVRAVIERWSREISTGEILLVPYGNRKSLQHPVLQAVLRAVADLRHTLVEGSHQDGRGAALRRGFLASRGRKLAFVSVDQACEPSFLPEALKLLDSGSDLVRANRRLPSTRFKLPVRLLHVVYGRHRMGLAFNRLVRLLLPAVRTTDTHSGTFAVSRRLALHAFAVQSSPDFLADIELSLAATALGLREGDLPAVLNLSEEKSPNRILKETLTILHGLPILAWRYRHGCYAALPKTGAITADDWGISPGVNRGILELARLGVIRRVSMMADCPHLREGIEELKKLPGVELGLHFNLTYGSERPAPAKLLLEWIRGRNALAPQVREDLARQLGLLKSAGVDARYVDGHHHIHLLPGLIDEVADVLRSHGIRQVRLPYDPALWWTPKFPFLILSLLARGSLRRHGFQYLPCFYPKPSHFLDHGRMRAELSRRADAEVIVHPAESDDVRLLPIPDSYSSERVLEYRSLRMLANV